MVQFLMYEQSKSKGKKRGSVSGKAAGGGGGEGDSSGGGGCCVIC